jgi:hypothetical protein
VKQRVEDELLARPEVTAVDISHKITKGKKTDQLAIVVSVKKKKPKGELKADERIPEEIDGIPTDVVEDEVVLQPALAPAPDVDVQVDPAAYVTLQGGIGMGPCRSVYLTPPDVGAAGYYIFVGTLGVIVRDRTSGARMALTNFHVACIDSTWSVGDTMTQPGRNDGGSCPGGTFGTLERAVLTDHVDGSVITIDPGRITACQIVDIGDVRGTIAASVGMAVRKRGRTTGLTYGSVGSIDYSTSIDYGNGLGVRTLKNQIRVDVDTAHSAQFGDHGDSGSAVVNADNKVVGLHFAGNAAGTLGVANPIQFVLDELNVDVCTAGISVITRPVICRPIVTRPVVCVTTKPSICSFVTRPSICAHVTTPVICQVRTRPATCPVVSKICPPPATRACPDPGPSAPGGLDPRRWYGTPGGDDVDDAFWEGYYAALDAVTEAEAEGQRE